MQAEREIAAAPETVWALITDIDRSAEVISAITAVERLDAGEGFGVGTRWKETRRLFGREASEEMRVTAVDEGRSYTVEADGNGVHYVSVMTVTPRDGGSRLAMSLEGEPTSFVARIGAIFGKLFEGQTRKMLAADLDDIARAAEERDAGAATDAGPGA